MSTNIISLIDQQILESKSEIRRLEEARAVLKAGQGTGIASIRIMDLAPQEATNLPHRRITAKRLLKGIDFKGMAPALDQPKRTPITAASRKRMVAGQKARWAEFRKKNKLATK